jgi:DNA-binding beta-propeller fold protein YncE
VRRWMVGLGVVVALGCAEPAAAEVQFVGSWGSSGNGPGQFNNPQDVAVDADGNVFVVDRGNTRIQRFDATGGSPTSWGSSGSGNGQFSSPFGIAVGTQTQGVYVADSNNTRVQHFDLGMTYLGTFTDGWQWPQDVAVSTDGSIYVVDGDGLRVEHRDGVTGALLNGLGSIGSGDGQFSGPVAVDVSPDGNSVYVVDSALRRVQWFSPGGAFRGRWGSMGTGPDQFTVPSGIAVSPDGTVWVTDTPAGTIKHFSAAGTYLSTVTQWGPNGAILNPAGVDAAPDGTIYVVSTSGRRIERFADVPTTLAPARTLPATVVDTTSLTAAVTLRNTASSDLPLSTISLTGADAAQFSRTGGDCPAGGSLAAGATCTVGISVHPTRTGTLTAQLRIDASLGAWSDAYTTDLTVEATTAPPPAVEPAAAAQPAAAPAGPWISALTAGTGPAGGGQALTVTGGNFGDDAQVWFGDTPAATRVTRFDTLTATTPPHAAGTVPVTVRTAAGTSNTTPYTYAAASVPAPATPATRAVVSATCVVPDLRGRTITAARRLAREADCALGRVTRTKARRGAPTPRVVAQRLAPATERAAGTAIAVTTRVKR